MFFTIVSVISEAFGRYCEDSLNPAFAHIWVEVFESAAVTVAMFFVIQFYLQLKDDLADHKPFLKVLCIKLVIFFSFWQTVWKILLVQGDTFADYLFSQLLISFLSSAGVLKTSKYIAAQDISIGIPSMLLCIEMAVFAIMHLFAFPWREYDLSNKTYLDPITAPGSGFSGPKPEYKGGKFGIKAWLDAFNPWDIIKASARGFRWLFVGRRYRHHDISYKVPAAGLDAPQTSIPGLNVTSDTVDSATELQNRGRSDTTGTNFGDRAGLLDHAQYPDPSPSPSRGGSYETKRDEEMDIGVRKNPGRIPPSAAFPDAAAYGGSDNPGPLGLMRWETDTSYHTSPIAQLEEEGQGPEWDHWGGARKG